MTRRPDDRLIAVALSTDERTVIDAMLRASGVSSEANLLRVALWSLADHLEIDMPNGVFDLRERRGRQRRRRPNPQIRQTA